MEAAKSAIKLGELGIVGGVKQKRAITGGLILEVPGPESSAKADALAERLKALVTDMGAIVSRPCKSAEMRVMDLDESITPSEVAAAVAEAGGCSSTDIKVGEIRNGPTRLGTVWVRCPLAAVRKLTAAKRVRVGWVMARVEALGARPLQCFRCLEIGHVRATCSNEADRSSRCFACGQNGHKARECVADTPTCPVCSDLGRPANHRLGSKRCTPPRKKVGAKVPPSPAAAKSSPLPAVKSSKPGLSSLPAEEEAMEA